MTISQQLELLSTHSSNHSEENNATTRVAECDLLFYLILKLFGSSSNTSRDCVRKDILLKQQITFSCEGTGAPMSTAIP